MSSPRRTILGALLATLLTAFLLPVPATAAAADDDPDVRLAIHSLSPSRLTPGASVTMTGTVTNRDDHEWSQAQAYLVIPASPFTTRAQTQKALDNPRAYTGVRVVDVGTFDELGDLAPRETRRFRIKVPYGRLGITGAEGVYPVGVQILATDTDGSRSPDAIARATTFLPLVSGDQVAVPTSIVWPFLMPDARDARGDYTEPAKLVRSIGAGGQLRNLLDLAGGTAGSGATVLLDPALLVAVDDVTHGRHLPTGFELTEPQKQASEQFLDDLLTFARARSVWVLDFDRPDDLALSQNPDLRGPLDDAIDLATEAALTTYQLSGRRVSWPTRNGLTATLLQSVRGDGDSPAIVTAEALAGWQPRLGSLVQHETAAGPMPLLVAETGSSTAGQTSVVALRQRLLSDAALATLERAIDPASRADAVTMVDAGWDPGTDWTDGQLSWAFSAPFTRGTSLDSVLTSGLSTYDGSVPTSAKARPLPRTQLQSAADIVSAGTTLSSVTRQSDAAEASRARDVAGVLGVRWRRDRVTGALVASTWARETGAMLDRISVEAPPSVTLSSSKGGFPLTITNKTDDDVSVGVSLDSSNPALDLPAVAPVEVGAGERRTLTVQVDLGRQRATFLTARLTTPEGKEIGDPSTFKVRSSSIGTVLWVAMGAAGLLVLLALVRRFHRRRTRITSEPLADDD
ncbi:MAG: hypothetical protein JWQ91_1808 [Aeromicrobium sp.]|uniref:DUF6049 family protein n=1 Tax=Aeromicrobium sp. TaxID=1871063 RepID=UPI002631E2DE|nr:DUF6049 family protein [Aeromicrobium sp.]MCW2824891.1 hypothetical protein [Aeromicrobium sp.]